MPADRARSFPNARRSAACRWPIATPPRHRRDRRSPAGRGRRGPARPASGRRSGERHPDDEHPNRDQRSTRTSARTRHHRALALESFAALPPFQQRRPANPSAAGLAERCRWGTGLRASPRLDACPLRRAQRRPPQFPELLSKAPSITSFPPDAPRRALEVAPVRGAVGDSMDLVIHNAGSTDLLVGSIRD